MPLKNHICNCTYLLYSLLSQISFDGQVATLVMSEAFPKNAGTYTVVAKNSAGEAQCSASVSVKVND